MLPSGFCATLLMRSSPRKSGRACNETKAQPSHAGCNTFAQMPCMRRAPYRQIRQCENLLGPLPYSAVPRTQKVESSASAASRRSRSASATCRDQLHDRASRCRGSRCLRSALRVFRRRGPSTLLLRCPQRCGRACRRRDLWQATVTLDQSTIVLERGACAHWAHRHTASWFINRACKMATRDRGWHLFVACADPAASERGVIFRAAGWHYCGQGRANGRPREYFRQRGSRQWICDRTFFSHRRLTMTDVALGDWHRKTLPAKHVFRVCLS